MNRYWTGERLPPADLLFELADDVKASARYLLTGERDEPVIVPAKNSKKDRDDLVEVAEIDPRFGLGGVFMDEQPVPEKRSFSRAWLRQITTSPPDELYWARGRGNSMAPTIEDGEIVLIDRTQQTPRDADLVWAFAWGEIGAIKRLRPMPDGVVKILSDNPNVPDDTAFHEDLHIFGRVVGVWKRI